MASNPTACARTDSVASGWPARLDLDYGFTGDKTVLRRQSRKGPLFVQKPFYPEGSGTCHTYVLHPPGGVVGGDVLELHVSMGTLSHAVITTPAAGKFYRSAGPEAIQINQFSVAAGAALEWLPQETIIYNDARVRTRTTVFLEKGAEFIGWEMICLGLPACKQPFSDGRFDQRFEIWRGKTPLLVEPLRITCPDSMMTAPWGLAGQPVSGTLAATTDRPDLLESLQRCAAGQPGPDLFSSTQIQALTVCRYSGQDVYAGLKFFRQAWQILRPEVTGRKACPPRIWAT